MYSIAKEFAFEASHRLTTVPDGHKCKRGHGHSYRVGVELRAAALNEHGFVRDYHDMDVVKRFVDQELDHRDLNEVLARAGAPQETTAENLARWLFEIVQKEFKELHRVAVSETVKTWAEYRP